MKKFWKYGLLAAGLTAFVACGDDSSSASSKHEDGEQREEVSLPKPSEGDTPVDVTNFSADFNDPNLSISANVKIDQNFEPVEDRFYNIDSLVVIMGSVASDGKVYVDTSLNMPSWNKGPAERAGISENIGLDKLEYGKYRLYLLSYSSDERESGTKAQETYVNLDSADFEKVKLDNSDEYSSSSEEKCTAMKPFEATLSTKLATDTYELNFKTGDSKNPHVILNGDGLELGEGVKIYDEVYSQSSDWEEKACVESFKADISALDEDDGVVTVSMTSWYIAKTPDGDFPFYVVDISSAGKGHTMTLTYYRK